MNGLGLAAFDIPTKSTSWCRALLPLNPAGDTVQVDITVANVEDGLFQSKVIVDFIEEVGQSLCIYSNVADGVGTPPLTSGHTALVTVSKLDVGTPANITTYSLYPDNYGPGIVNNGADSDVRVNVALDDYRTYPYVYCEMVTDRELAAFVLEVSKPSQFVCTENNAAAFAVQLFQLITGKALNAIDVSGLSTSRKVGQSIRALNGGSNQPPGGLPWGSRRLVTRSLQTFVNSSQNCGF
jgi:hypothetical protein